MDTRETGVGETTTLPTDVVIETAALIAALVGGVAGGAGKSAFDAGLKGSQALVEYLRKEGPMAHRVLASWKEGKNHCVALEFINATLHGGYVEKLEVKEPSANFDFEAALPKRQEAEVSFGATEGRDDSDARRPLTWRKQNELLPFYVPPSGTATILLRLRDDVEETLAKTPLVTLSYQFSIVGGDGAESDPERKPKVAKVRLRGRGPFYLIG